jgi:hypothetical protein
VKLTDEKQIVKFWTAIVTQTVSEIFILNMLSKYMHKMDINIHIRQMIVDRGFRDVIEVFQNLGYDTHMYVSQGCRRIQQAVMERAAEMEDSETDDDNDEED